MHFFKQQNSKILLLILGTALIHTACTIKDLYMIGLFPFHGSWNGGAAFLASSQLALQQINARDDVLPNYRLNLLWNDTGVSVINAILVIALFRNGLYVVASTGN